MILIIGGAYQGKLAHAKAHLGVTEEQVWDCQEGTIAFSKPCLRHLEEFCYDCVKQGVEPREYFLAHREEWQSSILICRDIFCGVVPVDDLQREWRQATGRLCQYLAEEADEVIRVFCGLGQRIK